MAKILQLRRKKRVVTSRTIKTKRIQVNAYIAKFRDREHWVVCIKTNGGGHYFIRTRFKEIGIRQAVHDTILDFRQHVNSLAGLNLHA
jgi:hypothetical protein